MMRRALALGVIGLTHLSVAGCESGKCGGTIADADAVTGVAEYRPASNDVAFAMSTAGIWSVGGSSLALDVTLRSPATTTTRTVRLELERLVVGETQTLRPAEATDGASAAACVVVQERTAPVCVPLRGTVKTKALASECLRHESGLATCVQNVDLELRSEAEESGLTMQFRLDIVRAERWSDPGCTAD